MVVWGEGGIGKSALILRMMHECSLRSVPKADVAWTDTRNLDYLGVMRKIRDDVGAVHFPEFTKLVNFYTDPQSTQRVELVVQTGQISVGESANISGHVGQIAGVAIRDLMLVVPRRDLGISESQQMSNLTDFFIRELNAAACDKGVVVFLDATEKTTDPTKRWIWSELLGPLREDRLTNVKFVIGSRGLPGIEEFWRPLIQEDELRPLKEEHIIEYLRRRNLDPGDGSRQMFVDFILGNTKGNPLKVAGMVDMWERRTAERVGAE